MTDPGRRSASSIAVVSVSACQLMIPSFKDLDSSEHECASAATSWRVYNRGRDILLSCAVGGAGEVVCRELSFFSLSIRKLAPLQGNLRRTAWMLTAKLPRYAGFSWLVEMQRFTPLAAPRALKNKWASIIISTSIDFHMIAATGCQCRGRSF